ncbi:MAG: hypothetical protein FWH21_05080, partial [Kiritimatiellaeota bacterium]|nr:hypothetical protein [Kiritimatiellota bacterium]
GRGVRGRALGGGGVAGGFLGGGPPPRAGTIVGGRVYVPECWCVGRAPRMKAAARRRTLEDRIGT